MKIQKYLHEFHDGALIDIQHSDNELVLSIESAEMDSSEMKDGIELSNQKGIENDGDREINQISGLFS